MTKKAFQQNGSSNIIEEGRNNEKKESRASSEIINGGIVWQAICALLPTRASKSKRRSDALILASAAGGVSRAGGITRVYRGNGRRLHHLSPGEEIALRDLLLGEENESTRAAARRDCLL